MRDGSKTAVHSDRVAPGRFLNLLVRMTGQTIYDLPERRGETNEKADADFLSAVVCIVFVALLHRNIFIFRRP